MREPTRVSGGQATVDLGTDAPLLDGRLLLSTHGAPDVAAGAITLRPWESRVLLTQ